MAPAPAVFGVYELAARWGISERAVVQVWIARDDFPQGTAIGERKKTVVWSMTDIEGWEQARRDAGLSIPGERPRGPEPTGGR
jgi:predicted DNA-binding transcriptional regulator AlpA